MCNRAHFLTSARAVTSESLGSRLTSGCASISDGLRSHFRLWGHFRWTRQWLPGNGESLPGVWGLVTKYCALIGRKEVMWPNCDVIGLAYDVIDWVTSASRQSPFSCHDVTTIASLTGIFRDSYMKYHLILVSFMMSLKCWLLIGRELSRDLNTRFWLALGYINQYYYSPSKTQRQEAGEQDVEDKTQDPNL